jgi:hypothetical protein
MSLSEEYIEKYTKEFSEIYAFFYKHLYEKSIENSEPKCCSLCCQYFFKCKYNIKTFDVVFPRAQIAIKVLLKNFTEQFGVDALPLIMETTKNIYKYLLTRHCDCLILKKLLSDTVYLFVVLVIAHRTHGAKVSTKEYVNRLVIPMPINDMNKLIYQTMTLCDLLLI